MSNSQLTVATRVNQADVLPVLLVAASVNEASNKPVITINYEDTALLHEGNKAVLQFTGSNGNTVYETGLAVQELLASFPFLRAKDEKLVNFYPTLRWSYDCSII